MHFLIADTFTTSLARLTGDEQRAAKTTAFDLQMDPTRPGHSFHRVDRAKDKGFWSVRVGDDLRLIVHRAETSLLLCYVDHHDDAYRWAERRKLETHPTTGAAQLVEVRERVEIVTVPQYVPVAQPAPPPQPLFARVAEAELLGWGVPPEWLDEVRAATEDSLLELADHLPAEAAEALLELATGGTPRPVTPAGETGDPFAHPDAQRRFRVVTNVAELAQALDSPWDKWTVFLHPAQREAVERDQHGPARVAGSAGTGKTVVALHRAVYLARQHPDARVLLTTFSDPLANGLRTMLGRLTAGEPRLAERLDVASLAAVGRRLHESNLGRLELAPPEVVREHLAAAAAAVPESRFSLHFLATEWDEVVDAWQLATWEAYRDVARLGRKTRLPERQRALLWSLFERVRGELAAAGLTTRAELYGRLAAHYAPPAPPPYDFVVVDEAQDVSIPQLRFLAAIGGSRPNALFFAGDLGQRIFQQPFSWKALGVDVRGRSRTLRINYRTSHQIRAQADRLLGPEVSDVDGNVERRQGTVSVFNGPAPTIQVCATPEEESQVVGAWLAARVAEGVQPHELGVFVRTPAELNRARAAAAAGALPAAVLDDQATTTTGHLALGTMHLAKGLEFRAVAVMACDDEVIPLAGRLEAVADEADLEDVYNTERQLLYVACTRARDRLLVTAAAPASEFLDDLTG